MDCRNSQIVIGALAVVAFGEEIWYTVQRMLTDFIQEKLSEATYKILKDRSYFGEIPGLRGVWANAKQLEACRRQLQEVLEEWLLLKVRSGERIPGFTLTVPRREPVRQR